MGQRGVLRTIEGGRLAFWCPGCRSQHVVNSGWSFNGDYDRPTFRPSVLVTSGHHAPAHAAGTSCWCTYNAERPDKAPDFECHCCHSFVTDGHIQFLIDSTHPLAGQTVALTAEPGDDA